MDACVLAVGIIDCVSGVSQFGEIADGIVLVGVRVAACFLRGCQSIQVIIAKVLRFRQQIVGDTEDIADFVIGICRSQRECRFEFCLIGSRLCCRCSWW